MHTNTGVLERKTGEMQVVDLDAFKVDAYGRYELTNDDWLADIAGASTNGFCSNSGCTNVGCAG